jgi:hypothetical protein
MEASTSPNLSQLANFDKPTTTPALHKSERHPGNVGLGFGAALVWCSRDVRARSELLSFLLIIFFLGGTARIISVIQFGFPSELYTFLGVVELILPPILWWWRNEVLARQTNSPAGAK